MIRRNQVKIRTMTKPEQAKAITIAERYLADAQAEADNYHNKMDLIGRALADQVDRMKHMLVCAKRGIPFGSSINR